MNKMLPASLLVLLLVCGNKASKNKYLVCLQDCLFVIHKQSTLVKIIESRKNMRQQKQRVK